LNLFHIFKLPYTVAALTSSEFIERLWCGRGEEVEEMNIGKMFVLKIQRKH